MPKTAQQLRDEIIISEDAIANIESLLTKNYDDFVEKFNLEMDLRFKKRQLRGLLSKHKHKARVRVQQWPPLYGVSAPPKSLPPEHPEVNSHFTRYY